VGGAVYSGEKASVKVTTTSGTSAENHVYPAGNAPESVSPFNQIYCGTAD
jgi:hypothetical protein